jgi:hypothetical protein
MQETFSVEYKGGRFFVANDTESALEILAAAGKCLPAIPKGFNTYWEIFTTAEGRTAAISQQIGFEEGETDMGKEVNGPMVVVCLEKCRRPRPLLGIHFGKAIA